MTSEKKRKACPYWVAKTKSGDVGFCMAIGRGICQSSDIYTFENCQFYQNYKKEPSELTPPTATRPRYPYYLGP